MSVLLKFSDPEAKGIGVRFAQHPLTEEMGTAQTPSGPFRYRIYKPSDVSNPGGIVVLHGVHHLGLEEPRLVHFSRALAAAGIEVMTPELKDLADYHVTPETIDEIGASAVLLSTQMKQPKVGVMGLSFAGGLALLAACQPEYAQRIGFVFTIGAHDDLARVARFFATNTVENPNGSTTPFAAHEYGVLILAYSHLEDFFSPQDVPVAREALRLWLWEQPEASRKAEQLSPAGHAEWELLLHHRDQLRQKFLDEIKLHSDEMQAVSPHGQIGGITVPVFILHGSGDTVIPATESRWLARDIPANKLKAILDSPAVIHANVGDTSLREKWALVDFLAQVLDSADKLAHRE
jgi:dienelactone hydrolase